MEEAKVWMPHGALTTVQESSYFDGIDVILDEEESAQFADIVAQVFRHVVSELVHLLLR